MTATAFELPAIEDADETVELTAWRVEAGQTVSEGQPIAEVETEKSVVEIDSPYNGTVEELLVDEWAEVAIGQEIATFEVNEAAGESADDADDADDEGATEETEAADSDEPPEIETPEGRVFAPPRVRRLARELGVDITSVEGSDESGRVTEADVREAAEDEGEKSDEGGPKPFSPSGKSAVSKSGESVSGAGMSEKSDSGSGPKPFTPSGKSAVSKGGEAVSSAGAAGDHVAGKPTTERAYYDTATVDRLVDLTSTLRSDAEAHGVELEPLPIIMKAVSRAIADAEISVDSHIGVGIRTDDGLAVPVVQDVEEKTLLSVAEEVTGFLDGNKNGQTATETPAVVVTEPGALGDGYATPPLGGANMTVGLGAIEPCPVVEDGEVVARETLPVSLAVDGDAVEPTQGAEMVDRLVAFLEEPSRLLLGSK